MFRCPTIDERVFAASLHHPTRKDGLRVPFPCDWHARVPSAAGTLFLSLVVRSFFFFFLFLFGSLSFVSCIACLVSFLPFLPCSSLTLAALSGSRAYFTIVRRVGCVRTATPPRLGVSRVQRRRSPLSPFCFFFLLFFYDGVGVEPEWDTYGKGSFHPPPPPSVYSFSFSFSPSLAMPIGLSLSLPSSSHTRPSPIDDGDHPSTRKGRRPGEGRSVEGNKVHRIHTHTGMGWHHWTWTMLWITWVQGTRVRYVHAIPHERVGREETTHQRTKRIARVRWYHGNPHHPIPWEKKETENETNPRRPVHTREKTSKETENRRQGPSHATNKRNETRATRVHGSMTIDENVPKRIQGIETDEINADLRRGSTGPLDDVDRYQHTCRPSTCQSTTSGRCECKARHRQTKRGDVQTDHEGTTKLTR